MPCASIEPPDGFADQLLGPSHNLRRRSEVIARTEMLRSFRSASIENYRANSDVVSQWVWMAACDLRTCPACWAMHGTLHGLDEEFGSHPQCRCSPAPITEMSDPIESGAERFEQLSAEDQEAILGPKKYELYRSGEIGLQDVVRYREDPKWGPQRNEASVEVALRQAAERKEGLGSGPAEEEQPKVGATLIPSDASIDDRKIDRYLLNPDHPVGAGKLKYLRQIGFDVGSGEALKTEFRRISLENGARLVRVDRYGERWEVRGTVAGPSGSLNVVLAWIRDDAGFRFVSMAPAPKG